MKKIILSIVLACQIFILQAQIAPPENVTASPNYICLGSSSNLSATVIAPNGIVWYDVPTGGTPIGATASGDLLTVSPIVNTTYYAEAMGPTGSLTLGYTSPSIYTWTVPAGVTQIMVDAVGASGATANGGKGGRVVALLKLNGATKVYFTVGQQGVTNNGGYNGGGGSSYYRGGGATDVRIGGNLTSNRVLVAGGGGGGGSASTAVGGNGGNPGTAGGNGTSATGGGGATISSGGVGGAGVISSYNGTAGTSAGVGGAPGTGTSSGIAAGNGGGGYFGGGGGGANGTANNASAGGGGGSSYVDPSSLVGTAAYTTGYNTGNGSITITWTGQTSTRVPVTVNITQAPTNVTSSNITNSEATLSWTPATFVDDYNWQLVAAGAGASGTAVQQGSVTSSTVNLSGLTAATAYDFYVRSQCSAGVYSDWTTVKNFTTTVIYPPSADFGNLMTPCNSVNKPHLTLTYSNAQNSPNLYSITSDIPDFNPIAEQSLTGGEIDINLANTTPISGVPYNIDITLKNSITGAESEIYSKSVTFLDVPTTAPSYLIAGQTYADAECLDGAGWTHYFNTTSNNLVLSISKNGWNPGTLVTISTPAAGEYSVNVGFVGTSGYVHVKDQTEETGAAPYVTNVGGWYIMDKSFDVKTLVQPTSPVSVRYYYEKAQYNALNAAIDMVGDPILREDSLVVYKLKTGNSYDKLITAHAGLTVNDLDFYGVTSRPRFYNFFSIDSVGSDIHYFEYNVPHFSGGGGGGAPDGEVPLIPPAPPVLPVELLNFKAYSTSNGNELIWQTASETNNDRFEIEGSENGNNFNVLGTVKSLAENGHSTQMLTYRFKDNEVSNHFYRLKQIDVNGTVNYSNTIEIFAEQNCLLYPNPATDKLNLIYTKAQAFSVQVFDINGKMLMSLPLENENYRQIEVGNLPLGVYFLKIVDEKNRVVNNLMWSK